MGRCKSLSLLKSFLSYASQLSRAFLVFFTFWASFPQGSPYGVAVVPWLLANRYSSPSWVPLGFTSSRRRVAITDDCDILVHWWRDTCVLSCAWLFITPLTVDARLLCLWNFPGKNTGIGCHFLLQGVFLTKGSTCLRCVSCIGRQILYHWAIAQDIPFLNFLVICVILSPD